MAIIFPGSPEVGDTFEAANGIIYQYDDGAWRLSSENQGSVGVHMDTSPPANPQNGDLWFHTGEADLKIYYIDPSSSQWIPSSSPPDPYEENFVSVTGDKMTGRLNMQQSAIRIIKDDGTVQFNLSPNSSDYFTNIYAFNSDSNNGGMRFRVAPGNDTSGYKTFLTSSFAEHQVGSTTQPVKTELNWLRTPTAPHHAANKQYVDDEIAALPVDDRIQGMPGTRYKYSDKYGDDMPDGCFHISGSGNLIMSRISFDGIEMASYQTDDRTSSVRIMGHVRGSDGRVLHSIVSSHWYQGVGNNQRIELTVSSRIRDGKGEMVEGQVYYITDGVYNF